MFPPSLLGSGSGVFGRARDEKRSRVKKMEETQGDYLRLRVVFRTNRSPGLCCISQMTDDTALHFPYTASYTVEMAASSAIWHCRMVSASQKIAISANWTRWENVSTQTPWVFLE
jgi:hypothetical protein